MVPGHRKNEVTGDKGGGGSGGDIIHSEKASSYKIRLERVLLLHPQTYNVKELQHRFCELIGSPT